MDAVDHGEALDRLRRRDYGSCRRKVRQDLNPSPAPVAEGGDAHGGVTEDRLQVWDPTRSDDVRDSCDFRGRVRADQEKPCARETRSEAPRNEFGGFLIRDIVEIANEQDVPGFGGVGQRGNPPGVDGIRQYPDLRGGFRSLRQNRGPVRFGGYESPGGTPNRLDLEPACTIELIWDQPASHGIAPPKPSPEEWNVHDVVPEEVPVHVVLVEDPRDFAPVLRESEEVQGFYDDEVRGVRRLRPREPRPIMGPQATQSREDAVVERELPVVHPGNPGPREPAR